MKQLTIFLLLIFTTTLMMAQAPKMKWGKIAKADLEMITYPQDEEAEAVILAQRTSVQYQITNTHQMTYDVYYRIKILSKAGLERANIEIPYYNYKKSENVTSIKAQVFTLKNGKIVKTKLKKKEIYNDKLDEYYSVKKFTLPAVEVGSIIEYKYTFSSENIEFLKDYFFQTDIPVKWSQFNFRVPEFFTYVVMKQVTVPFAIETQKGINYHLGAGYKDFTGIQYSWAMKDLPALKAESYITTMNDYRQRIRLQLKQVSFPGSLVETFFTTFPMTKKELMESDGFGKRIHSKKGIKRVKEACFRNLKDGMSPTEKIKTIYTFVQKNMKWDETNGVFLNESFDDIFKNQVGDAADINLMLLALLKQAGIKADPVLLSTRANGQANPYYPILKQFNYVIVRAIVDDQEILLDALNPLLPMGMVKFRALNRIGWCLNEQDGGQWIFVAPKMSREVRQIDIHLKEDGSVTGTINSYFKGYAGVNRRSDYLNSDDEKSYVEELFKEDIPDIQIENYKFENLQAIEKNFHEMVSFKIPGLAEVSGDLMYLNPFLNVAWDENPFQLKERQYPVDFGFTMSEQIIVNIHLPKGYDLEEMPKSARINLLEKGGSFTFMTGRQPDGSIQIISRLSLKKPIYKSEEYQYIKQFFDMVVDKQMLQLVIKKMPKVDKP